jgi:tetratricopeptide (TPR) repeat protein
VTEGNERLEAALAASPITADPSVRAKVLYGAGAMALNLLGLTARDRGDYVTANQFFERSLSIARPLGRALDVAGILGNMGILARHQTDYDRAAALYEESLELMRSTGNRQAIATSTTNLAEVTRYQGNAVRAGDLYRRSLRLHQEVGNKAGVAACVQGLAMVAWAGGKAQRAATLSGAATALYARIGVSRSPEDHDQYESDIKAIKNALGDQAFADAWAAGSAMDIETLDEFADL